MMQIHISQGVRAKPTSCRTYTVCAPVAFLLFLAIVLDLGLLWWIVLAAIGGVIGTLLARQICDPYTRTDGAGNRRPLLLFAALSTFVICIAILGIMGFLVAFALTLLYIFLIYRS